ncbi:MAG: calcium/sodium antiporter [Deferrisomatales bacterium]|nr:calcium/sodium antiporter [Deferrisomatales bacterium]
MLTGFALVAAGVALLYYGAGLLVVGASRLAAGFGVAPAVVGLTVVAFGTSLPELVVSVTAAVRGNPDIALGNIVGSNIANVGLILGLGASLRAMTVEFTLLKREAPMGLGAVALVVLLSADGVIGRGDAAVLLAAFCGFLYWSVMGERQAPEGVQEAYGRAAAAGRRKVRDGLCAACGLVGVLLGGHWLVEGGVAVAAGLGVPAVIIGLTVVAVGTSLPELAASLVAMTRGESDIGVGNVLGSNLFNLLGILGVAALVHPIEIPDTFFRFQYPVLAVFTLALLPIMRTGLGISRAEGALLLGAYTAYVAALFLLPGVG